MDSRRPALRYGHFHRRATQALLRRLRQRVLYRCLLTSGIGLGGLILLIQLLSTAASAESLTSQTSAISGTPAPHLGYGANVRDPAHLENWFAPLGLEWIKLYEQYSAMPATRLPYKVLFRIQLNGPPEDLEVWGTHVEAIARAGKGRVEAYEIGNEPNQSWQWGHEVPDPNEYVAALKIAYARVKAVDPDVIVVSGGLGPVGRIQATPNGEGWPGNNGSSMDEWEYARAMFQQCAEGCFDAFGYHPFGFAYAPETDADTVPENFAFRGAEDLRGIMIAYGLEEKPMWATEFGWIRDPDADGFGGCKFHSDFNDHFGWMLVTALQQADYLSRSFAYADEHWPWMGPMFIWNLDWNDQGWTCDNIRFFSLRFVSGEVTPAYHAVAEMEKRPSPLSCHFLVDPVEFVYRVDIDRPTVISSAIDIADLGGCDEFRWTVTLAPDSSLQPQLSITQSVLGQPLTFSLDTGAFITRGTGTMLVYPAGLYTALLTFHATPELAGSPQHVPMALHILPGPYRSFLPIGIRH